MACPSCGAALMGAFCHECGEAKPDHHDFSWKHALHDAVHEFLHLDGKIFQTLWLLIRRPGLLTLEYWQGRRRLHIRPLRLYIMIAAIHLIAISSSFYRMDFFLQMSGSRPLQRFVERTAARQGSTPEAVQTAVNEKLAKAYSVVQYFAVGAFALVPWALYRRRRPHYLQHFFFAIHVYCFYFLLTAVVSQLLTPQQWRMSPLPLVTMAYMYFAVRRLYEERPLTALWKSAVLRLGLFGAEAAAVGIAMMVALALVSSH